MKLKNWMIVDRCPMYRKGLVNYINQIQKPVSIEETNSGREALNKLIEAEPTIVIANIDLDMMDGIELFRTILHRGIKHHHFVFVSELHWIENSYTRFANFLLWHLKEIGVNHVSSKEELDETTLQYLFQSIDQKKPFISHAISYSYNSANSGGIFASGKLHLLSEREREYLLHFANHRSQQEIAAAMHIETTTVNSYRENVLKKFELKNTEDLKCFCSIYHLYNLNVDSENRPPPAKY